MCSEQGVCGNGKYGEVREKRKKLAQVREKSGKFVIQSIRGTQILKFSARACPQIVLKVFGTVAKIYLAVAKRGCPIKPLSQ